MPGPGGPFPGGKPRDALYPMDSVEAAQPHLYKQKRITAKDISTYYYYYY